MTSLPYYHEGNFDNFHRQLHNNSNDAEEESKPTKIWEIVYTSAVLLYMFVALLSDRVGADMVMVSALTLLMASSIISIEEGLEGFANEGLLTVLVLFVVAAGISHTGALDWYMGKLLGNPKNAANAQLRLMIPIAFVSAFLNNTPVVAVMIPIVQRWGKNVGVSPQQLLIPLSFASILGGTCTLIGTSTNLVVVGLLKTRYPGDSVGDVGLFDLGLYGVPIAMAGLAYVIVMTPCLLPGGARFRKGDRVTSVPADLDDSILLGARLTKWCSAAGRSVKRSGLRDTGGLYLVSVHRAATGNVHRAVGQEFVLNVGDILYFTGLVEGFGDFCQEHGLEVVTNEVEDSVLEDDSSAASSISITISEKNDFDIDDDEEKTSKDLGDWTGNISFNVSSKPRSLAKKRRLTHQFSIAGQPLSAIPELAAEEVGTTKESLKMSDESERLRSINRIQDRIRGIAPSEDDRETKNVSSRRKALNSLIGEPTTIVINSDTRDTFSRPLVVVGVNAPDRKGLLHDLSKGLIGLGLNFHHTEATVDGNRSLSIWRCEVTEGGVSDVEEIWSVLNSSMEANDGVEAVKHKGLQVIRAVVRKNSELIGRTAAEVNFRDKFKAAIIAIQSGGGKHTADKLSQVRFSAGDILVLQVNDDSPLLIRPPEDFYKGLKQKSSSNSLVGFVRKRFGSLGDLSSKGEKSDEGGIKGEDKKFSRTSISRPSSPALVDMGGSKSVKVGQTDKNESNTFTTDVESQRMISKISIHGEDEIEADFFIDDEKSIEDEKDNNVNVIVEIPQHAVESMTVQDEEKEEEEPTLEYAHIWKDLQVAFTTKAGEEGGATSKDNLPREFLSAMQISPHSSFAKRTVAQSGLNKLNGVYLISVERPAKSPFENAVVDKRKSKVILKNQLSQEEGTQPNEESKLKTVAPEDPLQPGDILWYAGSASSIGDLRKIPGLTSFVDEEVKKINEKVHDRRLVQAVIARNGPLIGKNVKEARFRTKYGAAVIAVHRDGKRVQEHPGKIRLQAGDVLLLEAGPTFIKQNAEKDKSFALFAEVEDSAPPRLSLLIPALALTVTMLAAYTAGVVSLLVSALIASSLMIVLGIMSQQEARDAINWDVYITIACAFGIGTALTNSGVAGGIADGLVTLGQGVGIGDAGLYAAVYFATFLISNVVTNNAAAALLFPIAMDAAEQTGADRKLMSYTLMLGASASFMSPFGYTTNLLIYGPGGYKYADFLRIGTPMQIILWLLSVALVSLGNKWYFGWIVTSLLLIVVSLGMAAEGAVLSKIFPCTLKQKATSDDEKRKIAESDEFM